MKKKLGIVILILFILFIAIMVFSHFINASRYLYTENLPDVKIKKTFSGNVDDVIDEFISRYVESATLEWPAYDEAYLRSFKNDELRNEFCIVAHHTFDKKEIGNKTTFYISYTYAEYSFINGVFTHDVFVENNPVAITLKKLANKKNTYKVTKIFFQREGAYYPELNEFFDNEIVNKYKNENHQKEIINKLHKKEKAYLKSIGRNEKIVDDLDFNYIMEDAELAENGYDYMYDEDCFIYDFEYQGYPSWIGTKEIIRGGKRYICKAKQQVIDKKGYIITYTKTDETGNVLEQYKVNVDKADYKVEKVI